MERTARYDNINPGIKSAPGLKNVITKAERRSELRISVFRPKVSPKRINEPIIAARKEDGLHPAKTANRHIPTMVKTNEAFLGILTRRKKPKNTNATIPM